jgi:hypothetical protein
MRAMTSVPPPAGKPTMMRTGFWTAGTCAKARGRKMLEASPAAEAASM